MPRPLGWSRYYVLLAGLLYLGSAASAQSQGSTAAAQNSIVSIASGVVIQNYISLQLDPLQRPVIAYSNYFLSNIVVTHCGDTLCDSANQTMVLDQDKVVTGYPSLGLNATGSPMVSYFWGDSGEGTVGSLRLAVCGNPACTGRTITVVDAEPRNIVGTGSSMQVDASGDPVISYLRQQTMETVAHCANALCRPVNKYSVLDRATALDVTSMALDSQGNPVVAYIDLSSDTELKVAHCSDPDCQNPPSINVVDLLSDGELGGPASLTLDSEDRPVLSYTYYVFQQPTAELRVAHCGDANCDSGNSVVTLDPMVNQNSESSVVIDSAGDPVVSYRALVSENDELAVARCGNSDCSSNNIITITDASQHAGFYNVLRLDAAGRPVVAYVVDGGNPVFDSVNLLHCATATCQ